MSRGKKTSLNDENKAKQTKTLKRVSSFSKTIGQNKSAPSPKPSVKTSQLHFPVSHTIDSELNIVVDELSEAAVV
ncbi:hypothetical protein F2Q70_00030588 [Brassica cretica]|uniref:Uncharacterized protein n=1 Tax=Brassica cretica TaxID=69181 RepID=A0A8S9FM61_BRACR|nr:hypothetical protein F2Q70_00030588 [Brassica cretica]